MSLNSSQDPESMSRALGTAGQTAIDWAVGGYGRTISLLQKALKKANIRNVPMNIHVEDKGYLKSGKTSGFSGCIQLGYQLKFQ